MNNIKFFLLFILLQQQAPYAPGQGVNIDSLYRVIDNLPADSSACQRVIDYANLVSFRNPRIGLEINQRTLERARKLPYPWLEAITLNAIGEDHHFLANFPEAVKFQLEALDLNRKLKDAYGEAGTLSYIGILYLELGQNRQVLAYSFPADSIYKTLPDSRDRAFTLDLISYAYDSLGLTDSALYYAREAFRLLDKRIKRMNTHLKSFILGAMGNGLAKTGKTDSALMFYKMVISNASQSGDKFNLSMNLVRIALLFYNNHA
jgi:tetratricopeptide (TPR) repeat protein